MNLGHENDQRYIILAVQTVLSLHKNSLLIDSRKIEEIAEEVIRKAQMFKRITEKIESETETENQGKTWGKLLRKLSDEVLMDSYNEANKLSLEEEFIEILLEELHRRGIAIDSSRQTGTLPS